MRLYCLLLVACSPVAAQPVGEHLGRLHRTRRVGACLPTECDEPAAAARRARLRLDLPPHLAARRQVSRLVSSLVWASEPASRRSSPSEPSRLFALLVLAVGK